MPHDMKPPVHIEPRRMLRWVLQGVALAGRGDGRRLLLHVRAETWTQLRLFNRSGCRCWWGMVFTAWACNGARVWLFCRALGYPLKYRTALQASLSQEFGVAATPAGIGGAVIRLTLLKRAGVPVAHSGSMLASDAAIDVLFFALLAPFAAWVMLHDALFAKVLERVDMPRGVAGFSGGAGSCGTAGRAAAQRVVSPAGRAAGRGRRILQGEAAAGAAPVPAAGDVAHVRRMMREALSLLWGRPQERAGANFCCRRCNGPAVTACCRCFSGRCTRRVNPVPLFLAQGLLFMISMAVVVPAAVVRWRCWRADPAGVRAGGAGWRGRAAVAADDPSTSNLLGGGTAFFLAVRQRRLVEAVAESTEDRRV
jgi:hypothetical protein